MSLPHGFGYVPCVAFGLACCGGRLNMGFWAVFVPSDTPENLFGKTLDMCHTPHVGLPCKQPTKGKAMATTKDGLYTNQWAEATRAFVCPLCGTKAGADCDETCPEFWNE